MRRLAAMRTGAASRERASDARAGLRERRTRASATPCAASRRTTRGSPSRTRIFGSSCDSSRADSPPRLDADADDANLDPAAEAAARDGDVIVDDYDAVLELMSGLQGGDDGLLSDDAVATLHEVAKQCKYLVDPQLRASTDEYVALLGRLQLNGFELTAAEASAETAGKHAPIGVGVFPSAARFNHSCEANAEQRFDKHGCIVVETRRAVPRGEELTIPYVDERLGWRERNERLRKNFAFTCECAKCKREREAEGERKRGR